MEETEEPSPPQNANIPGQPFDSRKNLVDKIPQQFNKSHATDSSGESKGSQGSRPVNLQRSNKEYSSSEISDSQAQSQVSPEEKKSDIRIPPPLPTSQDPLQTSVDQENRNKKELPDLHGSTSDDGISQSKGKGDAESLASDNIGNSGKDPEGIDALKPTDKNNLMNQQFGSSNNQTSSVTGGHKADVFSNTSLSTQGGISVSNSNYPSATEQPTANSHPSSTKTSETDDKSASDQAKALPSDTKGNTSKTDARTVPKSYSEAAKTDSQGSKEKQDSQSRCV